MTAPSQGSSCGETRIMELFVLIAPDGPMHRSVSRLRHTGHGCEWSTFAPWPWGVSIEESTPPPEPPELNPERGR